MKKLIMLLSAVVLSIGLAACGAPKTDAAAPANDAAVEDTADAADEGAADEAQEGDAEGEAVPAE